MSEASIIDVWAQRPGEVFLRQPWLATLNRWTGRGGDPAEVPAEVLLAHMDEAGIEKVLLSAWWGPAGELISNDSVAELVQAHPDRIVGVASADLSRPLEAVRTLRRYVSEYGFKALRIVPWFDEVVALSGKFPGFYVDTSAYVARRYPPALLEFMKGRGRERVMFGTNYPMLTPARCLAGFDALGLDAETRALFLSGNARRVFGL